VPLADDIRPGSYTYYCNIHQLFQNGTIEVVPPDEPIPSQAEVSREAYTQIKDLAAPLLQAHRQAVATQGETEIIGLTVRKPFAGWFPDNNETLGWINEFVPKRTEITAGQTLTWSFVGAHTVSFDVPAYFSEFVVEPDGTVEWTRDAVAPQGRRLVTNDADQPAGPSEPPSEQPSAEPAPSEDSGPGFPVRDADAGRWDGNGFLSSGVQSGGTYTVTFTKPGTYPYACLIHPRMVGEVVVRG
jgi:plastocyanin